MENVLSAPSTSESDDGLKVLAQGFAMIVASEIGDKTFLIAAILAMRHPRSVVFAGAFGALAAMSFLSAALGHVFPTLIPKSYTQFVASVLFFVFGAKMLQEGRAMPSGAGKIQEEMREAEEEIEEDDAKADGTGVRAVDGHAVALEELERGEADLGAEEIDLGDGDSNAMMGRGRSNSNGDAKHRHRARSTSRSRKASSSTSMMEGARNFFSLLLGPVFVQAFALTFLGEWGDRSQIATIALGAAHVSFFFAIHIIPDFADDS